MGGPKRKTASRASARQNSAWPLVLSMGGHGPAPLLAGRAECTRHWRLQVPIIWLRVSVLAASGQSGGLYAPVLVVTEVTDEFSG